MYVRMKRLDHIGIVVKDLDTSCHHYETLLGSACYKRERVKSEGVEVAFFKVGDVKIELICPIHSPSLSTFLSQRGEGLHHIAFEVTDIEKRSRQLQKSGVGLIGEAKKEGAENMYVRFLHPKGKKDCPVDTIHPHGVLIELCQRRKKI